MKNKIEKSINVLKMAAEISQDFYKQPLIIAYSGGKDSDVMLDLALKANINIEVVYSTTTVEAPQTMKHISEVFENLKSKGIKTGRTVPLYKGKSINMFSLIEKKQIPPTRLMRYCCSVFKENTTPNRIVAVGVREAESTARRGRGDFSTVEKTKALAKHFSLEHIQEVFENAKERASIWDCTFVAKARSNKSLCVNPIYEWTDGDVWEYIRENNLPYNELYDMGYSRVGCILCPMAKKSEKKRDEINFPAIKENYIKAFERMLKARKERGKDDSAGNWTDAQAVYRWWVEDDKLPGQLKFDFNKKRIDFYEIF